jgi:pimeloyl-ACP methyl ester carboxylesterase
MLISVLLTASTVLAAATSDRIYLPRPGGQYSVGKTQHVVNHTTLDDPMAPPDSNMTGSFFVVTVLYPTNRKSSRNTSLQYMDNELASQIEAGWQMPVGELSKLYTHIQWQPPALACSSSEENLPTLLFSPGFGMPCSLSTVVQAEMVSRGYTVMCIDHPGESPYLKIPHTKSGVYGIPINYQSSDVAFAYRVNAIRKSDLDALIALCPGLWKPCGAANTSTSSYLHFGFSLGGSIGTHLVASHNNVLAGVNFDGSFADALFGETVNVNKPFLMLRNDQGMADDPSWDMFQAAQRNWWQHLEIKNTQHHDFSDVSMWMDLLKLRGRALAINLGTISGERMRDVQTEFTLDFFDKVSGKKGLDLDRHLPSTEWPDVRFVNGSLGV